MSLIFLCAACPGLAQSSPNQLPVLTRADQVRRLSPEQAARGYPVRLRAVVTYFDPNPQGPDLFVQDATEGIWVNLAGLKLSPKPGQLVELTGISGAPDFAPQVEKPQIRVLGQAPMPVARPVSYGGMASTIEDSQWVEVKGIVRSAVVVEKRLALDLAMEGGRLQVTISPFDGPAPTRLVDAEVRIHGVCGTQFNSKNQLIGVALYAPSLDQVKIERRAPADPFAGPVRSLGSLLRFAPQGGLGHRVRVQGVVTLQLAGSLFVQDGDQDLRVQTRQTTAVQPGDRVDVIGFPVVGDYSPILQDAVYQKLGADSPPAPTPVTPEKILQGDFDGRLVSLQAKLVNRFHQPGLDTFILEASNTVFRAEMEERGPTNFLDALPDGSKVRMTGVCVVQAGENRAPRFFQVLFRSPQDVVLLERPSWLTAGRALMFLGLLGVAIFAVLGWVAVLRRRVQSQTETIRATLESTADGILVADSQGKTAAFNHKFVEMWRIPESIQVSRDDRQLLEFATAQLKDPETFLRKVKELYANPDAQSDDLLEFKDGRLFERHSEPQRVGLRPVGRVWGFRDVTERKEAEKIIQRANEKLTDWAKELQGRNREASLLNEMGSLLQTCLAEKEAYAVIGRYTQKLFPTESGALCTLSASRNFVEAVATWGDSLSGEQVFAPQDCWAVRSGRPHYVDDAEAGLLCRHVIQSPPRAYLCVPMMAQGEALGILYLEAGPNGPSPPAGEAGEAGLSGSKQQLATSAAEHIALALANLRLRETLRLQSIRDPLTGLFNRRYMEESLEREIIRAARTQRPLAAAMIDLDNFKHYNDTFGHEAGDSVLREVGGFLQSQVRGDDIACRYGGEEFVLILPEATSEGALRRAEQMREAFKHLNLQHRGQALGQLTMSLGLALFPDHGQSASAVLRAADAALYRAKSEGRDRVIVGQATPETA